MTRRRARSTPRGYPASLRGSHPRVPRGPERECRDERHEGGGAEQCRARVVRSGHGVSGRAAIAAVLAVGRQAANASAVVAASAQLTCRSFRSRAQRAMASAPTASSIWRRCCASWSGSMLVALTRRSSECWCRRSHARWSSGRSRRRRNRCGRAERGEQDRGSQPLSQSRWFGFHARPCGRVTRGCVRDERISRSAQEPLIPAGTACHCATFAHGLPPRHDVRTRRGPPEPRRASRQNQACSAGTPRGIGHTHDDPLAPACLPPPCSCPCSPPRPAAAATTAAGTSGRRPAA